MDRHSRLSEPVALLAAASYERPALKEAVARLCGTLGFQLSRGSRVLLKPNLVTARGHGGLACTHPEWVAAVAEWCLDQGARVAIGDSPAFGTARGVMAACGVQAAVRGLPVALVDFSPGPQVALPSGPVVRLAREALDCDLLINLPKIKAHGQLLVSLAVKNYFGVVPGWRKPCLHMRHGGSTGGAERFSALLVDLLEALPGGISLLDGVVAMDRTGPIQGEACPLGLVAGSLNPVAADTALLTALAIDHAASPLWREGRRRQLLGSRPEDLSFPLRAPEEFAAVPFTLPGRLDPIRFSPCRMAFGGLRRIAASLRKG